MRITVVSIDCNPACCQNACMLSRRDASTFGRDGSSKPKDFIAAESGLIGKPPPECPTYKWRRCRPA